MPSNRTGTRSSSASPVKSPGRSVRRPAAVSPAIALLLALSAGCATSDGFPERMNRFIGEPLEAAKLVIGDGYEEHVLDNGNRRLDWVDVDPATLTGYRPPEQAGFAGRTVLPGEAPGFRQGPAGSCRFTLFADPSGTVYDWQAVGERCRDLAP